MVSDASVWKGESDSTLPWIEKYRPSKLEDLVSQSSIIETLNKFIDNKQLPHLLFYGPPGSGKTSTILACAQKMFGSDFKSMVLELNASDDRGIDVVREQIKTFASTKSMFSRPGVKLIVLDEADSMTSAAQAALRRVVEKYVNNVRFCLICNFINGIIPALQSRCTRFRFSPLQPAYIREKVLEICAPHAENVPLDDGAIDALIKISKGDMRRVLNTLQSAAASFGRASPLSSDRIYQIMGVPSQTQTERIFAWFTNEPFVDAFANASRMMAKHGYSVADVIGSLFDYLLNVQLSDEQRVFISDRLAFIEHALNKGATDKVQLAALVGAFQLCQKIN